MERHLSSLSLREKCAQLIFIGFGFEAPDYDATLHFVKKEGVGGVCLEGGSIFDTAPLVNSLQRVAKLPLLIASLMEDGAGEQVSGATRFPPNMALGAAGSEDLALQKGRHSALEARALGIRWLLAPVVDLAPGPPGGSLGARSFGSDPALVTRLARAMVRGFRSVGVMGCAKHFPGGGSAGRDPATGLPVVEESPDQWRERGRRPFEELLGELGCVMTGHILAPALDPGGPASLSAAVTGGRLRRELGFAGLVSTDLLGEATLMRYCSPAQAAERAALSGADVILWPSDPQEALGALVGAVEAGRLPETAVDESVQRVLAAKERLGLFDDRMTDVASVEAILGSTAPRAAAQRIAEAAVTRVRGSGTVSGSVSLLKIAGLGARGDLAAFEEELGKAVSLDGAASTCVLALAGRAPEAGPGAGEADPALARTLEEARRHSRIVLVSFGPPGPPGWAGAAGDWVLAYGQDEFSQRAAARALAGRIPFAGKLPVPLGDPERGAEGR